MKLCIFSDVHGNSDAFCKMYFAEQKGIDKFIFLGDIFGYFYGQSAIIERMMGMNNLYAIAGNHEKNYISSLSNDKNREFFVNKYGSSYRMHLCSRKMNYITQLPQCLNLSVDNKKIGLFHTGESLFGKERVYPDGILESSAEIKNYNYVLLGHTHYRLQRIIGNTRIINPGSLGQPRDKQGFSYAVLDTQLDTLVFKNIEIDIYQHVSEVEKRDKNHAVCNYLKKKYGV